MSQKVNCGFGELDDANYPIISFTLNETYPTSEDVNTFLDAFINIIKRNSGCFVLIIDATLATKLPRDARESMGIGLQYLEKEYKARYLRNIVVINKIPLIIIFHFVKLVIKPVVPQHFFMKKDRAYDFAIKFMKSYHESHGIYQSQM